MKTISRTKAFNTTPDKVFRHPDDLGVTGMHMTNSSTPMMGGKLDLEFLTENKTGLGSKYRWTGSVFGMPINFTVEVTKRIQGKEKVWETVGAAELILYKCLKMHLIVVPTSSGAKAELSIGYEKPEGWFYQLLSFFLADWYCKWCLKNMLEDGSIWTVSLSID